MMDHILDKRLLTLKGNFSSTGAMQSYIFMLYEMIIDSEPDKILEIGVQHGQSTKTMLIALNKLGKGKLVSLDRKGRGIILDGDCEDLKEYWDFNRINSHDTAAFEKVEPLGPYDILFIDGDHTYEGVKQDYETYEPLVKPGGLIILHDIVNKRAGVERFWDEIEYEKVAFRWGHAKRRVIPGLGIVQKPGHNHPGYGWVKRGILKNRI